MIAARWRGAALAIAAGALAACAPGRAVAPGLGAAGASAASREALELLVVRSDAASAGLRLQSALARDARDPWARAGAALLARRGLDDADETAQWLALVTGAPDHALALVALRRLAELADVAPERAREIGAGLAPLLTSGRLGGIAAYRARVACSAAAEALGDLDRAVALEAENGAVPVWTLAGPFSPWHALDFDWPFAPETGELPARVPGAPLTEAVSRTLPAPDGTAWLDGEPPGRDVYYLAAEATFARGGRYLVAVGATASVRVFVDGRPVAERRAWVAHRATLEHVPLALSAGAHRLLVKLARAGGRSGFRLSFARADGAASDASFRPTTPGPLPATVAGAVPEPIATARELAAALEEGGLAVSRLLAGRSALPVDREAAKALLAEGITAVPGSAALHGARGDALRGDPTLDDQIARSRAEAELRRAVELDPGDAEARIELADILRESQRADDAEELLASLPEAASRRPAALAARSRVAQARGLLERAEALAGEAAVAGGGCEVLALQEEFARRRDAVKRADEIARARAACPGGRERLAQHLVARGDAAGALEALAPVGRARPAAVEPALARAGALVAAGDARGAAAELERIAAVWPQSPRIATRLADARELLGDAKGARAARERALALDGSDLALRRALAVEDGAEVLASEAVDGRAAIRAWEADRPRVDTSSAMVLDAMAIALYPGGTATERVHQIFQVMDQAGVEQHGEVSVPAGAQVVAVRTVKPDGRPIEPEGTGGGKGSISIAALEPGDYVELEYLRGVGEGGHGARGDFVADPFFFRAAGTPLFRSTYAVLAPAGLGLEVDGHAVAPPELRVEGDRVAFRMERSRVPALVPEPGAPGFTEFLPFVHAGVGGGREAMQLAWGDALAGRTRPTEEIRAFAAEIRAAAGPGAGPEALARAAWARVSRTILGGGAGLADDASEVLSRLRGSRLLLLQAVLSELGVRSRVALARPFSADPGAWRFPSAALFSAPLLRIDAPPGVIWLDPSIRVAPFGALVSTLLDCEALVLPAAGEPAEVVRTAPASPAPDGSEEELEVALAADGSATISGSDRHLGAAGGAVKGALERIDATRRRQVVEGLLARNFRGLTLESFAFEGEDDPEAPLTMRFRGSVPALARAAGDGTLIVDASLGAARLGGRYVHLAARSLPLLVPAAERAHQRIRFVPPAGFAVHAEEAREVSGPFGRYLRRERVEGGALVRDEELDIPRMRIPPERYPEFAAFVAAIDQIQARPIVVGR